MAIVIADKDTASTQAKVDLTPNAVRATIYDAGGTSVAKIDGSAVNIGSPVLTNQGGLLNAGIDSRQARLVRVSPDGAIRIDDDTMMLDDRVEGTTVDIMQWVQTTTTMTITQVAGAITLNSAAITTATTGAMHTSHRWFPVGPRNCVTMRGRANYSATASNTIIEWGFGAPSSATAATAGTGAFWRKDGTGQWVPVVSINGSETLGTVISNATYRASVAVGEYGIFKVTMHEDRASFGLYSNAGVAISEQVVSIPAVVIPTSHVQSFYRVYNSGTAGAAVQLLAGQTAVYSIDGISGRTWREARSGMLLNSSVSPTAFTQLANWSNSGAPTTRTLQNAAPAETTLGGLLRANSIAGGNTDLLMFSWTNLSPYTFFCTGIYVPVPLNEVVAVATTATVFAYFAAFNCSTDSLAAAAPYSPMRIALPGVHTAAIGVAANTLFSGNAIQWVPGTPYAVHPGRRLMIGCRELVGAATATETYLWAGVSIDGFFE